MSRVFSAPHRPDDSPWRDLDRVCLEPDDWIVLSMRDLAGDNPEEHCVHLFNRFYQAHGVSYRSGMGLSLPSREIVALHGGNLTAVFPVDGGSQFKIRSGRCRIAAKLPRRSA